MEPAFKDKSLINEAVSLKENAKQSQSYLHVLLTNTL